MMTFLPKRSYIVSAKCLDYRRLGKQRVEAWMIIQMIEEHKYPEWHNHPAVKMWWLFPDNLKLYYNCMRNEWANRGYRNIKLQRIEYNVANLHNGNIFPDELYASHRAALLAKNPQWYSQWGWKETPKIDYYWPAENH
jgi:hypothetical protein